MQRILTAAVLIPVVLYAMFGGSRPIFLAVIAIVSCLSYIEYSQILRIDRPALTLGLLAGVGLLLLPVDRLFLGMLLFALIAFALPLRSFDLNGAFVRCAAMFLGVLYVFGAMKTAYLLGARNPWWLFFALLINWIGDSGAYYIGRRFGKHKLAPRISPGKSWEGAAASVIFSMLFTAILLPRFLPVSLPVAALLALAGNLAGQIGDLAESALKRAADVKDSGALLPGHGGMLDRVDSSLFTLPVVYALTSWLNL